MSAPMVDLSVHHGRGSQDRALARSRDRDSDCRVTRPYKTTAIFDEETLPAALRQEHRTKAGTWGIIRLIEGELRLSFPDGRREMLAPGRPGLIRPQEVHWVDPVGRMRMQVEFYDGEPDVTRS